MPSSLTSNSPTAIDKLSRAGAVGTSSTRMTTKMRRSPILTPNGRPSKGTEAESLSATHMRRTSGLLLIISSTSSTSCKVMTKAGSANTTTNIRRRARSASSRSTGRNMARSKGEATLTRGGTSLKSRSRRKRKEEVVEEGGRI